MLQTPEHVLPSGVSAQRLAAAVVQLLQHGWPPAFLLVFDEVWAIIEHCRDMMTEVTGNACNMDILAWYVDPNKGHAGALINALLPVYHQYAHIFHLLAAIWTYWIAFNAHITVLA